MPRRLRHAASHAPSVPGPAAGDKNEEHFFVATQDKALQRRCMAVPGGAVLFASVNGVHLEQPSALQKQAVAQVGACARPDGRALAPLRLPRPGRCAPQ